MSAVSSHDGDRYEQRSVDVRQGYDAMIIS
jgi:hypothetical protein